MVIFIRLQISSFIATCIDFIVTLILTELLGLFYLASTVAGAISGGIVNFFINRKWIFGFSQNKKIIDQILKFIIIWFGSIVLNALGAYLFTDFLNFQYIISKIFVSVLVGLTYNQFFQKEFVFKY